MTVLYWCCQRYLFLARSAVQCTVHAPHSWRCTVPKERSCQWSKSPCDTGEDDPGDSKNSKRNGFEICFQSRNSAGRRDILLDFFFFKLLGSSTQRPYVWEDDFIDTRKSKITFPGYVVISVSCVSCGQCLFRTYIDRAAIYCSFLAEAWEGSNWKDGAAVKAVSRVWTNVIERSLQSLTGWFVTTYSTAIFSVTGTVVLTTLIKTEIPVLQSSK